VTPANTDPSRFQQLLRSWAQADEPSEAEAFLEDLTLMTVGEGRPLLDHLCTRAHPEEKPGVICVAVWTRIREAAARAAVDVLEQHPSRARSNPGSAAELLVAFEGQLQLELRGLFESKATRALELELEGFGSLASARDPHTALETSSLSTLSLVIALLGKGDTQIAQQQRWSQPIDVSRDAVVQEVRGMPPVVLRRLLRLQEVETEALLLCQPLDRTRAMLTAVERSGPLKRTTPGTGFAKPEVVARLFGIALSTHSSRQSRVQRRIYDAWTDSETAESNQKVIGER
jgi:hypothetical protein